MSGYGSNAEWLVEDGITSKDDITAGDGAKRDTIPGKGALATKTTCNVFHLLKECGIPVAFDDQVDDNSFVAPRCTMLPYEVVVRREAHGSYLKRAPHLSKGHLFPQLVLEFFLKTSGKKWKNYVLPCDDPFMVHNREARYFDFYNPKGPNLAQTPAVPFMRLVEQEVFSRSDEANLMEEMGEIARHTFLVLERAWQIQGRRLVDFKIEFGLSPEGKLLLADVIDNDSWRVVDTNGQYLDKQRYRDGDTLENVAKLYRVVADITSQFSLPRQQLVIWRGSNSDDPKIFDGTAIDQVIDFCGGRLFYFENVVCSIHKQPSLAYRTLHDLIQKVPDTVVIAYVGMSNGAGPTLSANCTVPVITVPAGWEKFPEDVWSSLRGPSDVPVMTVLRPANAVLAAFQILAMRNPAIYAALRFKQEERLTNDLV